MYLVARTFRDANGVFGVGTIVYPTSVKAFKSRLQQRHIIDINEANLDHWRNFFANRYGLNLDVILSNQAGLEDLDTVPEATPSPEAPIEAPEEPTEEPVEEAPIEDSSTDW